MNDAARKLLIALESLPPAERREVLRAALARIRAEAGARIGDEDLLRTAEQANEGIAIGSYPFFKQGRVGANFVVRSEEEQLARKVAGDLESALASAGYEPVEGGI